MSRNRFKILIVLMSIALAGLLLLQFFWIKNVFQVTEKQFSDDVKKSLESTASDLEKMEATRLLHPDLFKQGLQGSYADFLNSEFGDLMTLDETIEIKDTVIMKNDEAYRFLVVTGTTIDTATGLLAEHKVITKKIGDMQPADIEGSVLSFQDSNSFAIPLNNSFEKQIMLKAQYLNEMMVKMFTSNYFDDIGFRINLKVVDSLIAKNLLSNKIDTSYGYNILSIDERVNKFSCKSPNFEPALLEGDFITTLFPNDIVPSNYQLTIRFPKESAYLWRGMASTLVASFLLVLIIVFAFYFAVSTIYKQKQISEIRNDFISNMTHELKTPISTISLACEAIQDPDVSSDKESLDGFVEMIAQENKRLAKLVENVLQTALLEKGKMRLQLEELELNVFVKEVVDAFQIRFGKVKGQIQIDQLDEVVWKVDRIHFGNIIYNLLDNALKYCDTFPVVNLSLIKTAKGFELIFKDNGIGIKKEDHKRIFEKLYRVPTGDVHNVKGFGLGLNYVESIVHLHKGEITVNSSLGKGSTFKIKIENE